MKYTIKEFSLPEIMQIANMITALEEGIKAAEALEVGKLFLGAYGAAEAFGFPRHDKEARNPSRQMFVHGFLSAIDGGKTDIWTNKEGIITRMERKAPKKRA